MAQRKKNIHTPSSRVSSTPKTTTRKKKTSRQWSEKQVIVLSTIVVLAIMITTHLSGCLNEAKADVWIKNYKNVPSLGVNVPMLHSIHGIDVSVHQGYINWKKVKSFESDNIKIDFAFIKATEGRTKVDKYFKANWKEAQKNDIIRGAYHFMLPNKSGKDQAELFLKTVSFEKGDLVPVCDIEITGGADIETIQYNVREWLEIVTEKVGKKPLIYSSQKFYEKYLAQEFSDYPFWIAHYHVPRPSIEDNLPWHFWQHTDKAKIPGITKKVDLNVFNGSIDELDYLRL